MHYLPDWPLNITPITAFGLLLLIGAAGGYMAHRLAWLPSITGFLLVGFICGPGGIGLLSVDTISESKILVDIALALILYRLGLSLDMKTIARSPTLLVTAAIESGVTFGVVLLALYLIGTPTPIAILVSAIAISSSPAVLLHVAHEVRASGIVTESTKTLVALNNLISFVVFSAALPALFFSAGSDWITIILQPIYGLAGSFILGLILAYGLHTFAVKTKQAPQYQLALVIGAVMIAVGMAAELRLSTLFTTLVMGIVVKSLEHKAVASSLEFGSAFELFFIVLFVIAGANLHVQELIEFAPAVLVVVLARVFAKGVSVTSTLSLFKLPLRTGVSSSLLLIPLAGLAIGLTQTSSNLFPQYSAAITAIVLGAVTVFETIGPPIAAFAFRFAGEAGSALPPHADEDEAQDEADITAPIQD